MPLGSSLVCSIVSLTPISHPWVTTKTLCSLILGVQTQIVSLVPNPVFYRTSQVPGVGVGS